MSDTTVTKTYNMGRVVGWSTYEEFLKENPNIDPSVVTPMVYSTMVTYGVTRKVGIPATADKWQPVQGTDTVFYTATVEVPGATFGAVPVVGIDYNDYVSAGRYKDADGQSGANKELLEKAFNCIFTCYVSDVNGTRADSPSANSGYLTFAAYPDIIDYLDAVSALVPNSGLNDDFGSDLRVIVRGLSLSGFTGTDDKNIYFGPQGLVVTSGGTEAKYCEQETVDISALCLNASGYIWMSTGGGSTYFDNAPYRELARHPRGDVLVSTFGYLNPDFVEGTGAFENLGAYAFTYEEYQTMFPHNNNNVNEWNVIRTQVEALEAVSADEPKNYVYLIDGRASYDHIPGAHEPLYIIPVRKSDYYVNVGTFADPGFNAPLLKRRLHLAHTYNEDGDTVIVAPTKVLPNYLGSFWGTNHVPAECKLSYFGNGSLSDNKWLTLDVSTTDNYTAIDYGRLSTVVWTPDSPDDNNIAPLGEYVVFSNQSSVIFNGLFQSVRDTVNTCHFVRRGAYLAMNIPTWVTQKSDNFCWKVDLTDMSATVENGVLKINNSAYVYPGELIVLGTKNDYRVYLVLNTITDGNPELILSTETIFTMEIADPSATIGTPMDDYTDYIVIAEDDFQDAIHAMTKDVYTDTNNTYSFTLTNTDFTPGILFNITHHVGDAYGGNKEYRYSFVQHRGNAYRFASGELWTSNSNLSNVAGHPGTYNSVFPCYGQTLPTEDRSWHYNAPAVLAHTQAKKLFQDFGYDIADYVHEDYQNISLGKFLQECVLRNDLISAMSDSTMRSTGVNSTLHLYSKADLNYTSGVLPTPTDVSPITASLVLSASTSANSYFSTAYYTAVYKDGTVVDVNNPDYPIWASVSKSPEGMEITSVSVTDNSGSQLDFSGNSGTIEADTIKWLDLLVGLGSGKSVDVLKGARFGRDNNDCNYIETADGTRLYISTTEPTGDIPEGSIGIGW